MKRRGISVRKFGFHKILLELFSWVFGIFFKCLPITIFIALLYFTFFGVRETLFADPYFQVSLLKVFPKGILTSDEYRDLEREAGGKNLLHINLERVSSVIKSNPNIKYASIVRRLPNELEIYITPRIPLTELHLTPKGESYVMDDEGIVMSVSKSPNYNLIQFSNYYYPKKKLEVLEKYQHDSLKKLPKVLQAFQENDVSKREKIDMISVDHLGNFSIFLVDGPELRICENVKANLLKLGPIANILKTDERYQLAYIDLCLNDVVVQRKLK